MALGCGCSAMPEPGWANPPFLESPLVSDVDVGIWGLGFSARRTIFFRYDSLPMLHLVTI